MKKLLTAFLLLLLLAGCSQSNSTDSTYETIQLDKIEAKVKEGYIVLDVREVNEFEEGHIPGAVNKPLSELQKNDFSTLNKEEKYVVICRSGNRSKTASELLFNEGYQVVNVAEGMSSWQGAVE